ncbi:MAG: EH signature domain-containing protein [Gallionella sp.]|jgi:hypothetical protein
MDALDKLQRTLRTLNQVALAKIRPGDSLQMLHEQARLREWVKGSYQLEDVPLSTIEGVLRAYRQNKNLKGLREIRLVCYGCTQGSDADRLIENTELFEKLLKYVDHYKDRRRTFRKLYRGLLSSYFSYDPDFPDAGPAGRSNWATLRRFLGEHLVSFVIGEFTPDWLSVLAKYPELLGEEPGLFMEASLLQGDWSVFDEICERLALDGRSWLVRQLVMAPLMAVGRMDDSTFRDHLDSLLLLLNDYPLFAGTGLQVLLDRYARCKDRAIHAQLRDFAVGLWGNPWLPDNAHQWQCGAEARAMLGHWLRRLLLKEFFGLLSNDDKANPRRLNFWDLYSEDLTGMYFALGREAYVTGNMALYKFRSHAKGLVAKLTEEKHGVHTCILQFKHHHVVEFNRENNVAYFYDTRKGVPAFYFAKGWIDIGAISVNDITQNVDVARVSTPLRHQDSRQLSWEGKFAQELGVTANAIAAFCRRYQCVYDEQRNGRKWIRPANHDQYGQEVWSVLKGWGFSYLAEENAYCRLT